MTDVLEVLLELELLQEDLKLHPLKEASLDQSIRVLSILHGVMAMIMRDITSKDLQAHLEQISSGDMT